MESDDVETYASLKEFASTSFNTSPFKKQYETLQEFASDFELRFNTNLKLLIKDFHDYEQHFEQNDIELNPDREILWRTICWCLTSSLYKLFGNERPSALRRWLLSVLFFVLSSYVMCIANVLTEYRRMQIFENINVNMNDNRNNHKLTDLDGLLPDLGFDFADYFTPFLTQFTSYPDIAQMGITVIAAIWLIFDVDRKTAALILRRYLVIQGILCLSRAICLLGTQLPNPYSAYPSVEWCKDYSIFVEAIFVSLRIKVTSTDVFFSGHSMFMVSMALTIEYYIKPGMVRHCFVIFLWFTVIFSLYMIVAVKFHYTIDVIIGASLTLLIWKLFHMALEYPQFKEAFPVLYFLEGDTKVTKTSNYSKQIWTRQATGNIISPRFNTPTSQTVPSKNSKKDK